MLLILIIIVVLDGSGMGYFGFIAASYWFDAFYAVGL